MTDRAERITSLLTDCRTHSPLIAEHELPSIKLVKRHKKSRKYLTAIGPVDLIVNEHRWLRLTAGIERGNVYVPKMAGRESELRQTILGSGAGSAYVCSTGSRTWHVTTT